MTTVRLDGALILSEADFHRQLVPLLDFGPYHGRNLAALWDRLSTDVPRPVHLLWADVNASRTAMGPAAFDAVLRVLNRAVAEDAERAIVHDRPLVGYGAGLPAWDADGSIRAGGESADERSRP